MEVLTVNRGCVLKRILVYGAGNNIPDDLKNAGWLDVLPEKLVLEEDSHAEISIFVLPGFSGNIRLTAEFAGERADLKLCGAYICTGEDRLSLDMEVRHEVPGCHSDQIFKGLAAGHSRADFFGRIIVAENAIKTEAYQANHNLLLSDTAKVDTKPQLEIYADDVKCSHGATIGRLDEEEQFYMRSRGIPLDEAVLLQIMSFVSPVIGTVPDGPGKDFLVSEIEQMSRNLLNAGKTGQVD